MWTKLFWKATAERAIKTFAQAAVAFLASDIAGILEIDWEKAASVSGLAALLSVLTSIASVPAGDNNSPSLLPHGELHE